MTPTEMLTEAVLVTVARVLTVFCLCAMAGIVSAAFWQGRGVESVWPDEAQEPGQPDIPRSSE